MKNDYTNAEIIKYGELAEIRKNALIKEGSELVFIDDDLNEMELKLMRAIITQMGKSGDNSNIIKMKIRDIIDFCHFDPTRGFRRIYDTAKSLKQHNIEFIDNQDKSKLIQTSWILKTIYEKVKNEIYVYFLIDADLKPYLGIVSGQYLQYEAENSMKLHGQYTIRIYEICAFYKNTGWGFLTIDEIRKMFCLDRKKGYTAFANIKQKIIEPAIVQINQKTDLLVEVEYIKEGRKVTAIKFFIQEKEKAEDKKTLQEPEKSSLPKWAKDFTEEQMNLLSEIRAIPVIAEEEVMSYEPELIRATIDYVKKSSQRDDWGAMIVILLRQEFIKNKWKRTGKPLNETKEEMNKRELQEARERADKADKLRDEQLNQPEKKENTMTDETKMVIEEFKKRMHY